MNANSLEFYSHSHEREWQRTLINTALIESSMDDEMLFNIHQTRKKVQVGRRGVINLANSGGFNLHFSNNATQIW